MLDMLDPVLTSIWKVSSAYTTVNFMGFRPSEVADTSRAGGEQSNKEKLKDEML